jgi:hypothetical protein
MARKLDTGGLLAPGQILTPEEVARLFHTHPKTVTKWAIAGKFPEGTVFWTPGGHRRYRAEGIAPFLNGTSR